MYRDDGSRIRLVVRRGCVGISGKVGGPRRAPDIVGHARSERVWSSEGGLGDPELTTEHLQADVRRPERIRLVVDGGLWTVEDG